MRLRVRLQLTAMSLLAVGCGLVPALENEGPCSVTLEYNDARLAPPYVGPLSPAGDPWPKELVRVQGHGWTGTVWINETDPDGTMATESSLAADEFNSGQMLVGWQEPGRYRYTFDNLAGCRSAFEIDVAP